MTSGQRSSGRLAFINLIASSTSALTSATVSPAAYMPSQFSEYAPKLSFDAQIVIITFS